MRVGYDQGTAIISGILILGGFDTSPLRFSLDNWTPPMLVLTGIEPATFKRTLVPASQIMI
jgi:hypothetical protein